MHFWDWTSGYCFQRVQAQVQPGSLDSEAGIYAVQFDMSGSRLITAEADKTIKVYKEDDTAVSRPVELLIKHSNWWQKGGLFKLIKSDNRTIWNKFCIRF